MMFVAHPHHQNKSIFPLCHDVPNLRGFILIRYMNQILLLCSTEEKKVTMIFEKSECVNKAFEEEKNAVQDE